MFSARQESERIADMEVRGGRTFRRQARAALLLLQPLAEFALIRSHLAMIRQGRRSGVTAWAESPVFTVGTATWAHSPHWLAGAIAHDAYHAKLYRDARRGSADGKVEVDAWSGKTAERACLIFQREVLLGLQAGRSLVDHVEKHLHNPAYQGRTGAWVGWLDYRKRWW